MKIVLLSKILHIFHDDSSADSDQVRVAVVVKGFVVLVGLQRVERIIHKRSEQSGTKVSCLAAYIEEQAE